MLKNILALTLGLLASAPALADLNVKNDVGTSITIYDYVIGGKHYGVHVSVDSTGAPIGVTGNPFHITSDTPPPADAYNCATDATATSVAAIEKCMITRINTLITLMGTAPAQDRAYVGARLQDAAGTAFGTNVNPVNVAFTASAVQTVGYTPIIAAANFTTPTGTTAYAIGNLIANSATAGSVTPLTFNVCRTAGGSGALFRARVKTTDPAFSGYSLALKLYRDSPTPTNGDHAAYLTTESNFIASIPVSFDQVFTDAVKGIGQPQVGSVVTFECATGSQAIYGLLVSGSPVTPTGGKVMTVVVEGQAN